MGTGASKAGKQSINALKVIKSMQRSANVDTNKQKNIGCEPSLNMTSPNPPFDVNPEKTAMKGNNGQCIEISGDSHVTRPSVVKNSDIDVVPQEQNPDSSEHNTSAEIHQTLENKAVSNGRDNSTKSKESEQSAAEQENVKKGNDDEKEDEEDSSLTTDEIKEKINAYYEEMKAAILLSKSLTVRDRSQETEPYTKEFRAFALIIAKSYFHFKPEKIPYTFVKGFRLDLGKYLTDSECTKVFCDTLAEALNKRDFWKEDGKKNVMFYLPMKNCLMILMNFSDAAREVKLTIGTHQKLLKALVDIINDMKDAYLNRELHEDQDKVLKWCMSILHNSATLDENVPIMRDLGVIKAVIPYLDSHISAMRLCALSTLADIVNEEESELLQTNHSIYKFLLKTFGASLIGVGHKHIGWSAEELARTVRQLARNDANKKILVDLGCLSLLTTLLQIGNDIEAKEAIDCLWILSFNEDNKKAMMTEANLVDHVVTKLKEASGTTKYSCHGLLWSLKDELMTQDKYKDVGAMIGAHKVNPADEVGGELSGGATPSPDSPESPAGPKFKGHVMISYQWGNQEMIKSIVHELRARKIPVWLDIDYMGGSTLQAMAKAVENSFAVIVAMSQKYKDSPNTRAEAEYAFQLRKTIIPLIMQPQYHPDGWLGLILGSKLYYDFSGKYSFDSRMKGLLKAILDLQDAVDGKKPVIEQPIKISTSLTLTSPTKPVKQSLVNEDEVKSWKSETVKKWLTKHKLETYEEQDQQLEYPENDLERGSDSRSDSDEEENLDVDLDLADEEPGPSGKGGCQPRRGRGHLRDRNEHLSVSWTDWHQKQQQHWHQAVSYFSQNLIHALLNSYSVYSLLRLSGEEILFLHKVKNEAPEFFYKCLETRLQLQSILDISRAAEAFSDLSL